MEIYGYIMIIFGICLMLAGLYIYFGHNSNPLLWRGHSKNATKKDLKYIGKITMLTAFAPVISAFVALLQNSNNAILPVLVFVILIVLLPIMSSKIIKK